ncbi:endonuclease/exonuclease/phosphatase family protein [Sorangium sp. So ce381]|uniref:endonuclease/exonuclease/phosphatase family protein n=1 Tax=Sorangium sp. So ce381 TaxID=3133307 RepID=UPI003F5B2388
MPTIQLLTWNLCKRDAPLSVLVRHIASLSCRQEAFIAAVQECFDDSDTVVRRVRDLGGAAVYATGNGTMSVFCSAPLEANASRDDVIDTIGGRLILTRTILAGQRLAIVNYHGMPDGLDGSPHHTERGGIASEARWRIDEHAKGDPVVVLGDFNAAPTSPEVVSRYCFSLAPEPAPSSGYSHNRARSTLRIAPLDVTPSSGTYLFTSTSQGTSWRVLDFLAAGPGLAVRTRVLDILDGEPLTNGRKPTLSDHLPVAGTLDLP